MPDRRCLTCLLWLPAFPEDDLRSAERALEMRRGFGAALAGACTAPGRGRHVSSRHVCERWVSAAQARPHAPLIAIERPSPAAAMPCPPLDLPAPVASAPVASAAA